MDSEILNNDLLIDYAEYIKWTGSLEELWNILYKYSNNALYMEWYQENPKTLIERKEFYTYNKMYLPELVRWNIESRKSIKKIVNFCIEKKISRICEYGRGIGTISIELFKNKIHSFGYEINNSCNNFYIYRLKKYGFYNNSLKYILKKEMVICLDVLEHLEKPIEILNILLNDYDYIAVNFSENFDIPMHLDSNKKYIKEFKEIMGKYKMIQQDIYEVNP